METPPERARSALAAWLPALVPAAVSVYMVLTLRGGHWHESHEWIWYPVRLVARQKAANSRSKTMGTSQVFTFFAPSHLNTRCAAFSPTFLGDSRRANFRFDEYQ